MKSKISTFLFVCISTIQPSFSNELPLTETQLYATLGVVTGFILNDENADEIVHKGITYGIITSPSTNKVWLDRNLGATQKCTAFNDVDCYGDYYQWGRNTDGHEKLGAGEINTQPTSLTSLGSDFIRSYSQFGWDWAYNIDRDFSIRYSDWDICPIGFRVADTSDFVAEFNALNINNRQDAFESILALPSAGQRNPFSVNIIDDGYLGKYWTREYPSQIRGVGYMTLRESDRSFSSTKEGAAAMSIRCVKK